MSLEGRPEEGRGPQVLLCRLLGSEATAPGHPDHTLLPFARAPALPSGEPGSAAPRQTTKLLDEPQTHTALDGRPAGAPVPCGPVGGDPNLPLALSPHLSRGDDNVLGANGNKHQEDARHICGHKSSHQNQPWPVVGGAAERALGPKALTLGELIQDSAIEVSRKKPF